MSATATDLPKPTGKADVQTAVQPISAHRSTDPLEPLVEHDTAQLAYSHWEARGRPFGTPFEDWLSAEREIQNIQKERPGLTNLATQIERA
jgi:hypothetical protein